MRQGWFEQLKRWGAVAAWLVLVGFDASWIYAHDSCVRGPDGSGPVTCLIGSFFGTLIVWELLIIAGAIKFIQVFL
jgi:hypothetical protein